MIAVVDYGMGNLRSVSKALEALGGSVCVTADPFKIKQCSKLVLPGVGAFGDASAELQKRWLWESIRTHLRMDKPFLGICLGLQLLMEASEENPGAQGLGLFKGRVVRFRSRGVKIPHMGWNQVAFDAKHPLFKDVPQDSSFYFVHSYYAAPQETSAVLGKTSYGQETFAAVIGKGNVFSTQFHPEKSQEAGLQILKNFLEA